MGALARPVPREADAAPFLGVTRSALGYRWVERLAPGKAALATAVAQRHDVPDLLARILVARGAGLDSAGLLLDPALRSLLPDPSLLRDMDKAAERLAGAIRAREPMALFGDYDVDGAASVALMQRFLGAHGHAAALYIPDRLHEGYGPNERAFAALIDAGARLIVTLDCGTAAHDAIALAAARGVDVIVVDHHLAGEHLPPAYAVINPNRLDDMSGQGGLAAAGVTFMLLVAVARALRGSGHYADGTSAPDLLQWLDLVALATVCDVAPLEGLNRAFVAKGLKVLHQRRNPGLRALADVAGLTSEAGTYHLGFVLGPRINAGGRIGAGDLGLRLLLADDEIEAMRIAKLLDRLNRERKALETRICEEALSQAEAQLADNAQAPLLVCAGEDWHKGVIGLVASRLVERLRRPVLAIAWEGEHGTGSMRSLAGVDVGSAVRAAAAAGLIVKGGGHAMAAGLSLARNRLAALHEFLALNLQSAVDAALMRNELAIDAALLPASLTPELVTLVERAGPFGAGNPQPRFAFAAHRCLFAKPVGEAHVRCTLAAGDGSRLDAIAFRAAGSALGELLMRPGALPLHVAGHVRRDSWGGRTRIVLAIEDAADPREQGI